MSGKKPSKRRNKRSSPRRADVDPRPILARLEREPLVVIEKGKRRKMSTLEAMVRRQWAAAMTGNPRAIRQIVKWGKAHLDLPQDNTARFIVMPDEYYDRRAKQ